MRKIYVGDDDNDDENVKKRKSGNKGCTYCLLNLNRNAPKMELYIGKKGDNNILPGKNGTGVHFIKESMVKIEKTRQCINRNFSSALQVFCH